MHKITLIGLSVLSLLILPGCTQSAKPMKVYATDVDTTVGDRFAISSSNPNRPTLSFRFPSDYSVAYVVNDKTPLIAYIKGPVLSFGVYGSPFIEVDISRIGGNVPGAKGALGRSVSEVEEGTVFDFGAHTDLKVEQYPVLIGETQGWEMSAYFKTLSDIAKRTPPSQLSDYDTSNEPLVALRSAFFDQNGYTYKISVISNASAFDSAVSAYDLILQTVKIVD